MAVSITARTTAEGLHYWPEPTARRDYLGSPHRHLFRVEVTLPVAHDDRDVEFHDLKRMIDQAVLVMAGGRTDAGLFDFGSRSCEQLARQLAGYLERKHGLHPSRVVWSEDGEFDAVLELPDLASQSGLRLAG